MNPHLSALALLFAGYAAAVAAVASCGEVPAPSVCAPCMTERECSYGNACALPQPEGWGTCAAKCSLQVWREGDSYDAPCRAGEGACPETCQSGHCTEAPNMPEGVGLCVDQAGAFECVP